MRSTAQSSAPVERHAPRKVPPESRNEAPQCCIRRLRVVIHGAVQGVGFRPFVYRLAVHLNLNGWVSNSAQGVVVEVQGPAQDLEIFLLQLDARKPPRASIQSMEPSWLDAVAFAGFAIRESDQSGATTALVLPDIATCQDCLREIGDPSDRRYRYPFTNCTNCGPRYTITEQLPYDRPNTSMQGFAMCDRCRGEYDNPLDRRFHAQPNACPVCGPQLEWWDREGRCASARDEALEAAIAALVNGAIVAVKGLGGFHLMVDAGKEEAVRRLRTAKNREEKPLALMYSSLAQVREHCELSGLEERLLRSPEAPIVLLRRRPGRLSLAHAVAPANPYLGAMLPYTPLHHLLLQAVGPVVATSGNKADEPICTGRREALARLGGIADFFLVHDRPIVRHVDDSIVRVVADRALITRRARGYAPLPVALSAGQTGPLVLGVGAHLKNAVSLAVNGQAFVSQHIGDLDTVEGNAAFERVIGDLQQLYETAPQVIARDCHPDYVSSRHAEELAQRHDVPVVAVQHHYAHVRACMAENQIEPPVLGIAWDGTGYGADGTVWGGEFLRVDDGGSPDGRWPTGGSGGGADLSHGVDRFERVAHLRTFPLPGGEAAVREPRRAAIGVLWELYGGKAFEMTDIAPVRGLSRQERQVLPTILDRGVNAPLTSSAGRLFDAVAAILGLRQRSAYEGQAAMELEFAAESLDREEPSAAGDGCFEFAIRDPDEASMTAGWVVDWGPMLAQILAQVRLGTSPAQIARTFHNTLVESMLAVAHDVGQQRVVLTGGCFQNKYLTERAVDGLQRAGFRPYWHQRIPPGDGGIALGQVAALSAAWKE